MTSSIRHQFFEFFQRDRPDFPLSNFRKKIILVLSLLSSFRSGLCTKYLKILTQPSVSNFFEIQPGALSSQQDCISLALREAFCPNIQPRAHARLTGLTTRRLKMQCVSALSARASRLSTYNNGPDNVRQRKV